MWTQLADRLPLIQGDRVQPQQVVLNLILNAVQAMGPVADHTIAVAREQGLRSFCLQAALRLAKLYQSIGRPADARAVLAPVLEGFSSTPEFPEIAEGQALLDALVKDDRVREALGRQQDP